MKAGAAASAVRSYTRSIPFSTASAAIRCQVVHREVRRAIPRRFPYGVLLNYRGVDGPRPRNDPASALIEFESPTPVSLYVREEKIQQVVILTESRPV
jgi:hypothetical protein